MNAFAKLAIVAAALLLAVPRTVLAVPSLSGPTGGLVVPDPWTLPPERVELAVSAETFDQLNSDLSVKTSFDIVTRVNVGVYDNLELGLSKTYRERTDLRDQPVYFSAKMRFPVDTFNVAVGFLGPFSGPDASALYLVGGWRSLWGGFGVNLGGTGFRELTTTQLVNVGISRFGGYSLNRITQPGRTGQIFTGAPDDFFGIFGFNYRISNSVALLGDFDGDRFSAGARFNIKELELDVAYVGQKEVDSLFSRNTQNVTAGVSHRF